MTTTLGPAHVPTETREQQNDHRPPVTSGGPSPQRRDGLMFLAVIFSGMALVAGIFGVGLGYRAIDEASSGGGSGRAGGAPSTATIHLTEFALSPLSVTLAEGGTLAVHNDGAVAHDLASRAPTSGPR